MNPSSRVGQIAVCGAWIGAAAALIIALGDFGASWLWLSLFRDRAALLVTLLAIELPVGAALGALLALAVAASFRITKRPVFWPLPLLLLATPLLALLSFMLFRGGHMSRLPGRVWLVLATFCVLAGAMYGVLRTARLVVERSQSVSLKQNRWTAAGMLALYVLVSKVDQHVYPNLYTYLHATLALVGWMIAALAITIVALRMGWVSRFMERTPWWSVAVLAALGVVFYARITTLDNNQNVRVALFDERAATSRSVMLLLEPLLMSSDDADASRRAIARARRARENRHRQASMAGLPTFPEAHVLLVTIDALRADHLGVYGYRRPVSPHIDAFAARSVVFDRAYTQAPHSSYSLSSLMVSEYLHDTVAIERPLPTETVTSTLNAVGYHTSAFFTLGIFHTEGERLTRYNQSAFDFAFHDHHDDDAAPKTERVLEEIGRIAARGEPPSFVWVHYFDVHEPYRDTTFGTSDLDRYDGEILAVDRAFEHLVREVRRKLKRPVIVVLSADHGEEFREHGGVYHGSSLYEEQVRVPLIVQVPGMRPAHVTQPVELVDVAPTLLGLLDVPPPASMRGHDLRPLMMGRSADFGPVFSAVSHKRMVVQWPYKLIADLRFNLYEVYDLTRDPHERVNLADREPQRLDAMRGELYAFLDSLQGAPFETAPTRNPHELALARGKLGDRRAVEPLVDILRDKNAPTDMKRRACRMLGKLADERAAPALARVLSSRDELVAAEAAIALGRMYNPRGHELLKRLVYSEDPDVRARAAVSLGRLRDRAAVPSLIDALWVAEDRYEREEAVRWLGRLRDRRAVEPLLGVMSDFRLRYLVTVALGQIGDTRAYDPLIRMLEWEHHSSTRDSAVRALGDLGVRDAIARLVTVAATEPDLKNTSESLIRLGAIETGAIGGTDIGPRAHSKRGFDQCTEGPLQHDWDYLERTSCEVNRRASISLDVPSVVRDNPDGVWAVLAAHAAKGSPALELRVAIAGGPPQAFQIEGQWTEYRWQVPREALIRNGTTATLEVIGPEGARARLDHLLLVPCLPTVAAVPNANPR